MTRVRRLIFTGDILRPFPGSQGGWESATRKNIRWLAHLIGWQLHHSTGLPASHIAWEPGSFDARQFYAAMGLDLSPEAWAAVFHADRLPTAVESQLAAPFADALVIGIELPDVLQGVLTRCGVPFLDIVAHPVRFMDDLLFAFRTNDAGVHARLLAHAFNTEQCVAFANLHRAKVAWMPSLDVPAGTALITGQVATDKAVIDRRSGRFLSLADFVERLFEVCERHPRVIFKPHPYQSIGCPSLTVIQSFGSIQIVNDNFYYLMGQDAITDVYAISSGTVGEAPYFGKRGHTFAEPPYEFGERPPETGGCGACVPIGAALFAPAFWSDVLSPILATRSDVPEGPPYRESRLRRSLNADWDHGFIDAVVRQPSRTTPAPGRAAEPAMVT